MHIRTVLALVTLGATLGCGGASAPAALHAVPPPDGGSSWKGSCTRVGVQPRRCYYRNDVLGTQLFVRRNDINLGPTASAGVLRDERERRGSIVTDLDFGGGPPAFNAIANTPEGRQITNRIYVVSDADTAGSLIVVAELPLANEAVVAEVDAYVKSLRIVDVGK